MDYGLLLRTVIHLRPTQVYHQIKYRLVKPKFQVFSSPVSVDRLAVSGFKTEPIPKNHCLEGNRFMFLNLEHEFSDWNYTGNGMLWAYNQNYFDFINQPELTKDEGLYWIDKFIYDLSSNKVGLDPYPIALRSINWIKFFLRYPEAATRLRVDSLYSQVKLLEKKLEYHLLGNHLLEDAYALYIGASYFWDKRMLKNATKLLFAQLKEQILPDGSHYEQSPMYHCILLDRLLDCINIRKTDTLVEFAEKMLGHLVSIVWSDGNIPMLNDSAYGIAPTSNQIFDYANRLNIKWNPIPMKECGYRKLQNNHMEAIIDVGNITATYQPGHTHADTFNYELRIDGKPFVVDTGISTYNKTERRQLERSTVAHNTVSISEKNSSEVWGGFRVGQRCHVGCKKEEGKIIEASHWGFEKKSRRIFSMNKDSFTVEDLYDGEAVSYIHLAEGVDEKRITIENADCVEIKPWKYSTTYNKFYDGNVIVIHFKGQFRYTIQ